MVPFLLKKYSRNWIWPVFDSIPLDFKMMNPSNEKTNVNDITNAHCVCTHKKQVKLHFFLLKHALEIGSGPSQQVLYSSLPPSQISPRKTGYIVAFPQGNPQGNPLFIVGFPSYSSLPHSQIPPNKHTNYIL